jgi:uncharacterized membrane protein YjgN (DUF898 family)
LQNFIELYSYLFSDAGVLFFSVVAFIVMAIFASIIKVISASMEATAQNEAVRQQIIEMGELKRKKASQVAERMKQIAHE